MTIVIQMTVQIRTRLFNLIALDRSLWTRLMKIETGLNWNKPEYVFGQHEVQKMNEHVFGSSFESVFISADGFQKILKLRIDRQGFKF